MKLHSQIILGIVASVMTISMSTCSVMVFDLTPEQAKHKRLLVDKESAHKLQLVAAMERLVNKGIDPVGARCGIMGWESSTRTYDICAKYTETLQK